MDARRDRIRDGRQPLLDGALVEAFDLPKVLLLNLDLALKGLLERLGARLGGLPLGQLPPYSRRQLLVQVLDDLRSQRRRWRRAKVSRLSF